MQVGIENRSKKIRSKEFSFSKETILLVLVFCFFPLFSSAQCAMCRAALESSDNTEKAAAVNDGIIYLMIIPYLLAGVIAYAVYRSRRKAKLK
jgi:ABC-type transport system involved in Fe-S cluster assembly fused permease/ATPase subunit